MSIGWRNYCSKYKVDPNDKVTMKAYYCVIHTTPLNEDQSIKYVTEQSQKDLCDINCIIAHFPQKVIASKMAQNELQFADVTESDYQKAFNLVKDTERQFMLLPAEVRRRFNNTPGQYMAYLAQPTAAADTINDVYKKPKTEKGKDAPSMKDKNKDGIPDKLQETSKE